LSLNYAQKLKVMASSEKDRVYCWDVDGVLIKFDAQNPANDWRKTLVDENLLQTWEEFQKSPAWRHCLCDANADTLFWLEDFLEKTGADKRQAKMMVRTWLTGNITPDLKTLEILKDLRNQGYQCAIASNQDGLRAKRLEEWLDSMGLQDVPRFFSCRMGIAKPDKRFYQKIQDSLAREPGDFYLIDDSEEYIQAALTEGWHGQLVRPGFSPVLP